MVLAEYKPKRQKLMTIPCTAQTDKKLKYVRYADDFLIAVKGNREDCQWIKSKLAEFIGDTLKMELSEDKTLITHSSKCARFLGYDVRVRRSGKIKRGGPGHVKMRTLNGGVELLVPLNDKIRQFVFTKGVAIQKKDGSMFPVHRKYLVGLTDLEIVSVYNAELRGICNYYGMASNFCKLHYLAYLMEYSCLKTLASKHKTSLSKTIDKFNDGTGKWGIPYETKQGNKRRYFANYADCKGKGPATDYISNAAVVYGYAVNTLENRLKAKVCELCGTTESDHYEVHHINKLKNLKGKERWEIATDCQTQKDACGVQGLPPVVLSTKSELCLNEPEQSRILREGYVRFPERVAQTYHSNVTRRCFPTPPHHLQLGECGHRREIPQQSPELLPAIRADLGPSCAGNMACPSSWRARGPGRSAMRSGSVSPAASPPSAPCWKRTCGTPSRTPTTWATSSCSWNTRAGKSSMKIRLGFRLRGQERFFIPGRKDPRFTEEGIQAAIQGELSAIDQGLRPAVIPRPVYQPFRPHPKYRGFLALYVHYLYLLGKAGQRQYPPRMTPQLRRPQHRRSDTGSNSISCGITTLLRRRTWRRFSLARRMRWPA